MLKKTQKERCYRSQIFMQIKKDRETPPISDLQCQKNILTILEKIIDFSFNL